MVPETLPDTKPLGDPPDQNPHDDDMVEETQDPDSQSTRPNSPEDTSHAAPVDAQMEEAPLLELTSPLRELWRLVLMNRITHLWFSRNNLYPGPLGHPLWSKMSPSTS